MKAVIELGYVGIEASDLNAWQRFAVDLLGMQLASADEHRLVLRTDNRAQRIVIEKGQRDDLAFAGFECANTDHLKAMAEHIRAQGFVIEEGSPELATARAVEALYVTEDPEGNRVELYCGPAITDAPFTSSCLHSGFVTAGEGVGHYFLICRQDRQTLMDFYVNILGMKVSDYIRQELAPGMVADAAFMHCNRRHHTLAIAALPIPKRMHHLMIEVDDMADVGAAYDRCLDANVPIEKTLGMHPNDQMLSFYATSPSGFAVEFGWGGIKVDDANWSIKSYDKLSSWGHRSPPLEALLAGESA